MEPAVAGVPAGALTGRRIGLLGGSFNPAHDGHLFVSREAVKRLRLERVWWLVAPQNPLKDVANLAPFQSRLEGAKKLARGAPIDVLDMEARLNLRYTVDTLKALTQAYPRTRFVWLMGADCLIEFPGWKNWEQIFKMVPIAVFARPLYSMKGLSGQAAGRFRKFRIPAAEAERLSGRTPPAWTYLEGPQVEVSSTALRAKAKAKKRKR